MGGIFLKRESRPEGDINDKVFLARKGDERAAAEIMRRCKRLVASIARKYYIAGADDDDIYQEAMIGLYKAIVGFDPAKNENFEAFVAICVTRHLNTAVKNSRRKKHLPLNSYVSIDSNDSAAYQLATPDPAETAINREELRQLAKRIESRLSDFERQVLERYALGYSSKQMAAFFNKGTKSIENAVFRIRKKLKTDG